MVRIAAQLLKATRITGYINHGLVTKTFDFHHVKALLTPQGRASPRQRDLPVHIVAYYVIALALFMQFSYREALRFLLECLAWLLGPGEAVQVTGKSGLSQTRLRPGWEVLPQLRQQVAKRLALETTPGAWERRLRGVSLPGSTLEVADEKGDAQGFGRRVASRAVSASLPTSFLALAEIGGNANADPS